MSGIDLDGPNDPVWDDPLIKLAVAGGAVLGILAIVAVIMAAVLC
jgi:hypothetical protein